MDKKVIFAVAGSGKTTKIISDLSLEKRFLLVTYTENNYLHLRSKIIAKFGHFPSNITLYTYFTFLHSFCFKPLFHLKLETKGINWNYPPLWPRTSHTKYAHYVDSSRRLYHNRIADLLIKRSAITEVLARLEKYFDAVYVDEVQDFAGHDFQLLMAICQSRMNLIFVGDFYQHTFDTSRDGNTNVNLHKDYEKYQQRFEKAGLSIDTASLSKSYRCSPSVCDFIREYIGIEIHSHSTSPTAVTFSDLAADAIRLHACPSTVKLFYQDHHKYGCYSDNWGKSKGADHYDDVCVVLNATSLKAFTSGSLKSSPAQTRNKLYVACSRPRGRLLLIPDAKLKQFKRTSYDGGSS